MRRTKPIGALFALIAALATINTILLQPYPTSSTIPIVSVSEPEIPDPPLDIGKTFKVNITLNQVSNLYTWQAGLTFNASVLEAISLSEGPFLKQGGTTLWVNGTIDNTNGIIVYHASSLAGNVTGVSGNGVLGTITFQVKDYGNSTLQLSDVILLNSTLKDIDKTLIHGTVQIKIPGDVNGDETVNVFDLAPVGKAYGSMPGMPNWNPDCDFNQDGTIDTSDLTDLSKNYGKTT